ncbi:MAG TPA: hypothetical protein VFG60_07780, partial [Burkholderiaceae bacterium]|nr:hypothetical protein [Burkholderiaceae bacterium]
MKAAWRFVAAWMGRSIGARMVALSLVLLFVIQVASFTAIRASLGAHARSLLPDLQIGLLVITLLGFGVFAFGSLFSARRVTTPLRELASAADRLGA